MSDPTRNRVNAAFDDELSSAPVPPSLRALSVRAAVATSRHRSRRPELLALVAVVLLLALVATLVIGSHVLRSTPLPAKPTGSVVPPPPRSGAAMVYDGARGQLVLFGGSPIVGGLSNETWTWDGRYWTLHRVSPLPSPRSQEVMAYDERHHYTVMYGGSAGKAGYDDDTWTWNGHAWAQQHPHHSPGFSFDWPATMAYDAASRSVILFGFVKATSGNQGSMTAETWSWAGSDWNQLAISSTPSASGQIVESGQSLVFVEQFGERVNGRYVSRMWRWDETAWTLLGPSHDLVTPFGSVAYDPHRGEIVMVNGDTWTWAGSTWARKHVSAQPPQVGYLAYFSPLHEVVSYGALYGNTNNDLWAWNGTDWTLLEAGNVAPPTPAGQLGPTTPDAAKAFIKQTMTATTPVLFPAWIPSGIEVTNVVATTDQFNLNLASDQRDKTIFLGAIAAQPPPGDKGSSDTRVKFRNALPMKYQASGYAEYFVYDTSAPRSDRWLAWIEPGTTSIQGSTSPGVWYFLSASGLTDQEFWQVANSLQ